MIRSAAARTNAGRRFFPVAIALAVLAFLAMQLQSGAALADPPMAPLSSFPTAQLSIRTAVGNVHQFKIWIADTSPRREQGLMFVESLDEHMGMLFTYAHDQAFSMWMKNTLIPLDMLFVARDGRIAHITANAVPQSLDIIGAPQPVRAVLELNGGAAERLGIREGDLLTSSAFKISRAP